MKGVGIGLMMAYILIAVVILFTIVIFSSTSSKEAESICEKVTIDKVVNWMSKMGLPAAQSFNDDFKLDRTCVEFVSEEGIKFKSDGRKSAQQVKIFRNLAGDKITFDLGSNDRIFPRDRPYEVTINPPNQINFIIS